MLLRCTLFLLRVSLASQTVQSLSFRLLSNTKQGSPFDMDRHAFTIKPKVSVLPWDCHSFHLPTYLTNKQQLHLVEPLHYFIHDSSSVGAPVLAQVWSYNPSSSRAYSIIDPLESDISRITIGTPNLATASFIPSFFTHEHIHLNVSRCFYQHSPNSCGPSKRKSHYY